MTELTSRQILDAIDRALETVSRRFAEEAAKAAVGSRDSVPTGNSNNAELKLMPGRTAIGKSSP